MRSAPLQFALKVAVSLALCAWLARGVAWADLVAGLHRMSWTVLGAALILRFVCQIIVAFRLHLLLGLAGGRLTREFVLKLNFAGLFVGNFLPSTVGGDALKAVYLKREGLAYGISLPVLLLDRLMNLGAVLTLTLSVLFVPKITSLIELRMPQGRMLLITAGIALFLLALIVAASRWKRLSDLLLTALEKVASISAVLLANPAKLAIAIALSLASELVSFTSVYLLAQAVEPRIGILEVFAVVGLVQVIVLLPVTLNGIGLQETAFVLLFSQVGLGSAEATLVALLVRFLSMLSSLPGLLWVSGLGSLKHEPATGAAET